MREKELRNEIYGTLVKAIDKISNEATKDFERRGFYEGICIGNARRVSKLTDNIVSLCKSYASEIVEEDRENFGVYL